MNCECVLIDTRDRSGEGLSYLADLISQYISPRFELYPAAISEITTPTTAYTTYDAAAYFGGPHLTINPGQRVLFIQGKLHHMSVQAIKNHMPADERRAFTGCRIVFPKPNAADFFTDIVTYD